LRDIEQITAEHVFFVLYVVYFLASINSNRGITMPSVLREKPLRFRRRYGKHLTILEGGGLGTLLNNFRKEIHVQKDMLDDEDAFIAAIAKSYYKMYGRDIVTEDELKKCSTPDARKMDLFYRGMLETFQKARERIEFNEAVAKEIDQLTGV
jgi:hypothetical protein